MEGLLLLHKTSALNLNIVRRIRKKIKVHNCQGDSFREDTIGQLSEGYLARGQRPVGSLWNALLLLHSPTVIK